MHTQLVNSVNQPFYNDSCVSDDSKFKVYTTVRHTSHFSDKIVLFGLLVCVFPASSQLISAASCKHMLHKTTEAPALLAECFGFFFHLSGLLLRVPGESAESSARRPPRPTRTAPFFFKISAFSWIALPHHKLKANFPGACQLSSTRQLPVT